MFLQESKVPLEQSGRVLSIKERFLMEMEENVDSICDGTGYVIIAKLADRADSDGVPSLEFRQPRHVD